MGSFILQIDDVIEVGAKSLDASMNEYENLNNKILQMYVDGASSKHESSEGIVLISPTKELILCLLN